MKHIQVMTLVATVAMIALTSSAQGPNYHDPKALPEERAADTYSVYEMALPAYGGDQYYIFDRAIRPNSGWRGRIEGCLNPPDELRGKVKEMLHDLELQADAYTLEPRMQLTKPYHFTSYEPAQSQDAAGNKLPAGAQIVKLGIVSFSKDRSLASVAVWTRGRSQWRVFRRTEKSWEEQRWAFCGAFF